YVTGVQTWCSSDLAFGATHVRAQRLGHRDRAVGLLEVLHHRDQGAPDRRAGAIERMHGFGLAAVGVAPARLHPPGLEIPAVRARRDLAIGLLRRQPDLQVVSLARGEPHVARTPQHAPVWQAQALEHGLGGAGHALEFRIAVLGTRDRDQLHLLELVLADHAAHVAAAAAGLRAEAQ